MKVPILSVALIICANYNAVIAQRSTITPTPMRAPTPEMSKWKLVDASLTDTNELDTLYYYRTDSIIETAPNTYKVWAKYIDLTENERKNRNGYYTLEIFEFRCKSRESRIIRAIDYDNKGAVVLDESYPDRPFRDIVPETIGNAYLQVVCTATVKVSK